MPGEIDHWLNNNKYADVLQFRLSSMSATSTYTVGSVPGLTLRPAVADDVPTILGLIKELAEYEHLSHAVTGSEGLFAHKPAIKCSLKARMY